MENALAFGAPWVSAISSAAALTLTFTLNVLVKYWQRPRLRLSCPPADAVRTFRGEYGYYETWLALSVTNVGRSTTAQAVQVFVASVASDVAQPASYDQLPRSPAWPLKWRDITTFEVALPARATKRVDLAVVFAPGRRPTQLVLVNKLDHNASPPGDRPGSAFLAGDGKYELDLALCAQDRPAENYHVTLTLDSTLTDEKRLSVTEPAARISRTRHLLRRVSREKRHLAGDGATPRAGKAARRE